MESRKNSAAPGKLRDCAATNAEAPKAPVKPVPVRVSATRQGVSG